MSNRELPGSAIEVSHVLLTRDLEVSVENGVAEAGVAVGGLVDVDAARLVVIVRQQRLIHLAVLLEGLLAGPGFAGFVNVLEVLRVPASEGLGAHFLRLGEACLVGTHVLENWMLHEVSIPALALDDKARLGRVSHCIRWVIKAGILGSIRGS